MEQKKLKKLITLTKLAMILVCAIALMQTYVLYVHFKENPRTEFTYSQTEAVYDPDTGELIPAGMPLELERKLVMLSKLRGTLLLGFFFGLTWLYLKHKQEPENSIFTWLKQKIKTEDE